MPVAEEYILLYKEENVFIRVQIFQIEETFPYQGTRSDYQRFKSLKCFFFGGGGNFSFEHDINTKRRVNIFDQKQT